MPIEYLPKRVSDPEYDLESNGQAKNVNSVCFAHIQTPLTFLDGSGSTLLAKINPCLVMVDYEIRI